MQEFRELPAAARAIAVAAGEAVRAADAKDAAALDGAVGALAALDPSQTGLLLGTVVRLTLEDRHPDGIGGDEVRDLLTAVTRDAGQWQRGVDPELFLFLLAGALGVHEPDPDAALPKPDAVARHVALLVAHLLDGRPFAPQLARAAQEIARTQLND